MVLWEAANTGGPEAPLSMRGTMYKALRERRKEIETFRMQKDMVPEGVRAGREIGTGGGRLRRTGGRAG